MAKQASIGYTASQVGCRKLCHSFGDPDSAGTGVRGDAESLKLLDLTSFAPAAGTPARWFGGRD
ncbi:hypothetical protein [Bradyrhizobium ivorense]|uniref:hypothetical protein n=1 Tax=Bradyrhizobium ivorense TaxID=2511166 RepID=UPI00111F67CC|nr:hypothetical protein [Bradyrhizobium ivorense]MCC8941270.1 hypothetical protein [Bradyrhizobium ivorense]